MGYKGRPQGGVNVQGFGLWETARYLTRRKFPLNKIC